MASWDRAPANPFGEEVERLPLEPDPLVQVIAQIRFSPVLSVQDQSFVAPFQEAVRAHYPLAEKQIQQQFAPGPQGGALQVSNSVLWRFSNLDRTWQVSLSETFVSMDCSDYTDRDDFMARLRQILDATAEHVRPVVIQRVGVRYVNRLAGADVVTHLPEYIRTDLLGLSTADLATGKLISQLTQAEFATDGVTLRGRWGRLLPDTTHEATVEPISEPSWILDLDAFTTEAVPFSAADATEEASRFAAIVYCFFRWSVSDEFLISRGATQ